LSALLGANKSGEKLTPGVISFALGGQLGFEGSSLVLSEHLVGGISLAFIALCFEARR